MTTPTMNKMVKLYVESASVERLKCGRPSEGTVQNTLSGVRRFLRWLNERREKLGYERIGFDEDFPLVSIVKPPLIRKYLADMLKSGVRPVTAMSYINQLQQLFARWMRPYYEDRGWRIPEFPKLGGRRTFTHYIRPSSEQLSKVKTWYESLPTNSLWFVATMMLEFAMRNGDIKRLSRDNFIEHNGRIFLNYTPHKTEHSSGRTVKWPIHPELWVRLKDRWLDFGRETFIELNQAMRSLGFTGTKGAYELRKICIDHIYQRFGAEMATSISGDDIKTIIRYYADPTQPNIGEIRITDLL
jgi:hypothetical protein